MNFSTKKKQRDFQWKQKQEQGRDRVTEIYKEKRRKGKKRYRKGRKRRRRIIGTRSTFSFLISSRLMPPMFEGGEAVVAAADTKY